MAKAKARPGQLGFTFDTPPLATLAGSLAGLERAISEMVATILNTDERPREVLAAEMSRLLDDEISRAMLDAYSSPAREGHKVPMSRALALVAVTDRHDLLDPIMRWIGAGLLVGDEIMTARIGQLRRRRQQIDAELKTLEQSAPLIRENMGE